MDPVLQWLLRSSLAALFAAAAWHKASRPGAFRETLSDYRVLPGILVPAAVPAIVALEAGIAVALLWPGLEPAAAAASAGLLAVYAGAIATNLARGRRYIDCGCLLSRTGQPLSGWLVARNGGLVLASLLLLVPPSPRALTWVDGVSITGGVAVLALLFHVANLLTAQAASPRLRRST